MKDRPDLILIMGIVCLVGTFGLNFQMTTAIMATGAFGKGSGAYGLLGSIMAIGSLAGALLAARRERPRLRLVIGATLAFGVFASISALMPTYGLFALSLIPVGLASLTLMTSANATVQLSVAPQMRGRVMALYMAIFMGGTPIGAPIIGWIGATMGPRWTILFGAVAMAVALVGVSMWLARSQNVRVSYESQRRPRVRASPPARSSRSRPHRRSACWSPPGDTPVPTRDDPRRARRPPGRRRGVRHDPLSPR